MKFAQIIGFPSRDTQFEGRQNVENIIYIIPSNASRFKSSDANHKVKGSHKWTTLQKISFTL